MTNVKNVDLVFAEDLKLQSEKEEHIIRKDRPLVRVKCFISDPNGYFTDEEAEDLVFGRRTREEVMREREAVSGR